MAIICVGCWHQGFTPHICAQEIAISSGGVVTYAVCQCQVDASCRGFMTAQPNWKVAS